MIKIGFRSFIHGIGQAIATSLYQEWKDAEEEKAAKEQKASFLASGQTAFGNVGGAIQTLGFDPFATYREAIGRGQGRLMFQVQRAFTPLLNEIRWNSNILNLTTGDVFLRNSEGLAIGQAVGTVLQGAATAIYPILAPVWMLFPWLGGMFGVGIQENGVGLDPGGFNPYSPGGGYDIWDALQDANQADNAPPPDPGDAVDIFVEPAPTPRPSPQSQMPKGTKGTIRKIWMLELTDGAHWM